MSARRTGRAAPAVGACRALLAAACLLLPVLAAAQAARKSSTVDADRAPPLAAASEPQPMGTAVTGVGNTIPMEPGSTLRCWQEGRLIFEQRFSPGQELVQGAPTLHIRDAATGRDVQAFTLKNAVCIVK